MKNTPKHQKSPQNNHQDAPRETQYYRPDGSEALEGAEVVVGKLVVNEAGAARVLQVSKSLLRKWRRLRYGPPWIRLGRIIRYSVGDLLEFIRKNRHE